MIAVFLSTFCPENQWEIQKENRPLKKVKTLKNFSLSNSPNILMGSFSVDGIFGGTGCTCKSSKI